MPQGELNILIVEDEKLYTQLAVNILQGTHRMIAMTAREGLDLFERRRPDITFLDIGLPDANGIDVLAIMKRIYPEAFIVILTSSHLAEDVSRAKHFGAAGYIVKPFTMGKVRAYLDLHNDYVRNLHTLGVDALESLYRECFDRAASIQLRFDAPPSPFQLHQEELDTRRARWNILLVDDDIEQAERLQARLGQAGCNVHLAHSAMEAMEACARMNYDLALVNHEMKKMSGIQIVHELRRAEHNMEIAIYTEDSFLPSDPTHKLLHISAFMVKPLKYGTFLQLINELVEKQLKNEKEAYVL